MTTIPEHVQTFASTPALAVSLPPAGLLPAELREVVDRFTAAREAAVEANSLEQMIDAPEHDLIAAEADHRLLAEGEAPTHVRKLEQDRGTARARAIDARRTLHETWYDQTQPAMRAARREITQHAAAAALAAAERWRAAVDALPAEREHLMLALQLVGFARNTTASPTWTGDPRQGSVEIAGQWVMPLTEHEVRGNLLRGLDGIVAALEAMTTSTAG